MFQRGRASSPAEAPTDEGSPTPPKEPRSSSRKARKSSSDGEKVLETIVLELPLPLGIGLDELNVIAEVGQTGSGASHHLQLDDQLIYVDGKEVRHGKMDVAEAFDRSRSTHTVVLQRAVEPTPGVMYLTVRLTPIDGSVGIGLTESNVVNEVVRGSAADVDGRLQSDDELLVVNGWDVRGGKRHLSDVLKTPVEPRAHEFIIRRRTAPEEKSRRNSKLKETGKLASFSASVRGVIDAHGKMQLPLTLDKKFRITKLHHPHDEILVGDTLVSLNGVQLGHPIKLEQLLSARSKVYELGLTRVAARRRFVDSTEAINRDSSRSTQSLREDSDVVEAQAVHASPASEGTPRTNERMGCADAPSADAGKPPADAAAVPLPPALKEAPREEFAPIEAEPAKGLDDEDEDGEPRERPFDSLLEHRKYDSSGSLILTGASTLPPVLETDELDFDSSDAGSNQKSTQRSVQVRAEVSDAGVGSTSAPANVEAMLPEISEADAGAIRSMQAMQRGRSEREATQPSVSRPIEYVRLTRNPSTPWGIEFVQDDDNGEIYIVSTVPDSPASQGALRPGDRIVTIDGSEPKWNTLSSLLQGPTCELGLERADAPQAEAVGDAPASARDAPAPSSARRSSSHQRTPASPKCESLPASGGVSARKEEQGLDGTPRSCGGDRPKLEGRAAAASASREATSIELELVDEAVLPPPFGHTDIAASRNTPSRAVAQIPRGHESSPAEARQDDSSRPGRPALPTAQLTVPPQEVQSTSFRARKAGSPPSKSLFDGSGGATATVPRAPVDLPLSPFAGCGRPTCYPPQNSARSIETKKANTDRPKPVFIGCRVPNGYTSYREQPYTVRSWFKFSAPSPNKKKREASPVRKPETFRALEEIEQSQVPKVVVESTPRGGAIVKGGIKARAEYFEQFLNWDADLTA
ncbi:hypothetical protein AB1Y20_022694 [Prymnesium parvum]|uniref:PDZ domain-containing protein n=1 Tax=Prymnesium parvum TaxID=97485 RepID=A0AB34JJP8_PRYPA